jgi:hypothetical protein
MKDFKEFLTDDGGELDEDELNDAMWDFIAGLDETVIDTLHEDQIADYVEIIEAVADETDDDDEEEGDDDPLATNERLAEAMPAKRVRRDVIKKRAASREHRKVKGKKKLEGRRKRKTSSFKRYKKKAKRLGKRGLTSTGKRKRTYINKG